MGMMALELKCTECGDKIKLELSPDEYAHYMAIGSLIEGSDAFYELFDTFGWVLQQMPFCDLCKYKHSEVYRELKDL